MNSITASDERVREMNSYVGFGFSMAGVADDGDICLIRRVAISAWGLFTISTDDLIKLLHATECEAAMPTLNSLTCVYVSWTRRECLQRIKS